MNLIIKKFIFLYQQNINDVNFDRNEGDRNKSNIESRLAEFQK